jgi:sugar phosphate permease
MVILGGIVLQCCVLGALLKPVENAPKEIIELKPLNNQVEKNAPESPSCMKQVADIAIGIFKEIINVNLLKENFSFLFIVSSNFFVFFAYFIPFIYLPVRAKELHIENYPLLLSIIGIVNIPGRITFGFVADRKFIKAINMNTICISVATACLFVFYQLKSFWWQAGFAVLYGTAMAGMNCLQTPYLIEAVGSAKFGNAFGITNLFRGLGCIFGPYVGGILSEKFNTHAPFLFAGTCYAVACGFSILAFITIILKSRKSSKETDETE